MKQYRVGVRYHERTRFVEVMHDYYPNFNKLDWVGTVGDFADPIKGIIYDPMFIYEFRLPEEDFLLLKLKVQFAEVTTYESL